MVTKGIKTHHIDGKMENSSVPPGFMSRTSFTLKRVDDNEEPCSSLAFNEAFAARNDATCNIFDTEMFKTSLRLRPWILDSSCIDNQDEYESGSLYMGTASSCPEAVLEEAPVFSPIEEEFKDSLKYIASIRHKAEMFGICRIVPPPSWKSSCLLTEKKVWSFYKFNTQVQQVDELAKGKKSMFHKRKSGKRKRNMKMSREYDLANGSSGVRLCETSNFKLENGLKFSCETFEKHADDFKRQYFCEKGEVVGSEVCSNAKRSDPSLKDIESEYWRIVENPTDQIKVLSVSNLDSRSFKSIFPETSSPTKLPLCAEYMGSSWNLHSIPKLPGSLLSFGNYSSDIFKPRLQLGMCFSSTSWKVEEHHVYSLYYMHFGAPKIWYGISSSYSRKFEAALKKYFPDLLAEDAELLHELVKAHSISMLNSMGIPVFRCIQYPKEFVLMLPGCYYCGFDTGFNCTEVVNFAPIDWLPHGQYIVDLYCEQGRKTSISQDKLLLRAATEAVKAQWGLSVRKKSGVENLVGWTDVCGADGLLMKALKSRVRLECLRREYLCSSSQSQKMDRSFGDSCKQECCICFYDLYMSAAFCSCSPNLYSCLNHVKLLCCCSWNDKTFIFRYEINELNCLIEALEGKRSAMYKWAIAKEPIQKEEKP